MKRAYLPTGRAENAVTPRAGAWIEAGMVGFLAHRGRESLPVRERGLKHSNGTQCPAIPVAPRAGAWIEAGRRHDMQQEKPKVAPRAGAWIEAMLLRGQAMRGASLPVRERGLKQLAIAAQVKLDTVAPRAGAWIEAHLRTSIMWSMMRRSPCGSVD